jgi:hypothetical protein
MSIDVNFDLTPASLELPCVEAAEGWKPQIDALVSGQVPGSLRPWPCFEVGRCVDDCHTRVRPNAHRDPRARTAFSLPSRISRTIVLGGRAWPEIANRKAAEARLLLIMSLTGCVQIGRIICLAKAELIEEVGSVRA